MPRPVSNPPNPWESTHVEYLGLPPAASLEVLEEHAKSLLSRNKSPDIPFAWSANPYRGCQHACAYCYARTSHQHLSFGAGTDFEKKIVVKVNAPELLRRELQRRSWSGEAIAFSGITDCYQPLEASYELTRRCLEVCLERRNPVDVITKAVLIRRDTGLLAELGRHARVRIAFTIPFADASVARAIEPGTPPPAARFEAMKALSKAGLQTSLVIAPLIPGLNESDVPQLLQRAARAGATHASMGLLRLAAEVRPVFVERLRAAFPERADHVLSALADMRGRGPLGGGGFGERMHGRGPRWVAVSRLFEVQCRRLGLIHARGAEEAPPTPPPRTAVRQGTLFEENEA